MIRRIVLVLSLLICSVVWAQSTGSIEGAVYDCTGAVVPGARVMLTDNYVLKTEAVSDGQGKFTFKDVEPGLHQVLVKKERFELLAYNTLVREERSSKLMAVLTPDRMRDSVTTEVAAEAVKGAARAAQPYVPPAGGKVEWMRLLAPPRPAYPKQAVAAGIEGPVVLFVRVKADGKVEPLSVVSSPDAELESAAREAVARMAYQPMTVNGKPVEFDIEWTFDFRLKQQ